MDTSDHPMDPRLVPLAKRYRAWQFWVGVAGLLYARRLLSSPPRVVRDVSAAGLEAKVREAAK